MPDETAADKRCKVVCKKVYKKTLAIYKSSRFENGRHDYGFKILNGPPRFKPPILFISYQPGGGKNAKVPFIRNHRSWPSTLEYLRDKAPETGKKYALWARIRELIGDDTFLSGCVAMNAIFFRAPNISSWETVPKRRQLEAHCLKNTQEIIAAIQPRLIVLNGMKTLKFFAVGDKDLEYNGRVLTRTTQIQIQNTSAIPAIATLHLSGARIPAGARAQIAQRIREKAGVLQI